MKVKLPELIANYVQASNETEKQKFLSCFTENATVLDEGETRTGREAIGKWFTKTRQQFQFKAVPLELKEEGDKIVMKAEVSGNFPGSPVVLTYEFRIRSGLIQDLRITV